VVRKTAREAALRLLTYRDRSCSELIHRLQMKGFTSKEIEQVIRELKDLNYLDDERFAFTFARQRKDSGYGPVRIRWELKEKGVTGDLIDEAVESVFPKGEERRAAEKFFKRRLQKGEGSDTKLVYRVGNQMIRRGYTPEVVYRLIKDE